MFSRLRGLAWLLLLLAVLVGVPALVQRSGVLSGPVPTWREVTDIVRQGRVSDDDVLAGTAVVLLVLWARFAVSVGVAVWCALRRVRVPHVRVLGGSTQRWATSMVAGVALLVGQHAGALSASTARATDGVIGARAPVVTMQVGAAPVDTLAPIGGAATPGTGRPVDTPPTTPPPIADAVCAPLRPAASSSSQRGLGAAVLLAGGAVGAVEWRRRQRLRAAGVSDTSVAPSGVAARLESQLRALSPVDRLVRLDTTVRALAARLVDASAEPSVQLLAAVVHDDGRVDLTLNAPATLDAPFEMMSLDWWRLPAAVALRDLAPLSSRAGLPSPCLAHLGRAEGGELFVDLEALGLLCIDADASAAEPVMRSIVASLCTSPFSGGATVVAAGVAQDDLLDRPAAERVDSVDAALDLAAVSLGSTTGFTSGGTSTFRLRSQGPNEGWDPALVLIGGDVEVSAREAHDLVELTAAAGRGLAVVVGQRVPGATWRLEESAGMWTLQPLGMVVDPVTASVDEIDAVRRLLQESSQPVITGPDPIALRRHVAAQPVDESPPFREPRWSLVVRVMGPVAVETSVGVSAIFDKARSLELVVWLSLHRERPSRSAVRTALWETDVRDATFANIVSEARRALTRATNPPADGEWLARSLGDALPLHPDVVTDADLLERRLEHSRRQTPADAVQTLRAGLAWVRGLPFADSGYLWPDGDGITSRLVLLATTAATEMASLCRDAGDIEGVFWATGRGLSVLPGHEELVGLRMRAHADRGDLSAVRLEWDSYLRALHADTWGDADPSPKLVALRHELLPARAR